MAKALKQAWDSDAYQSFMKNAGYLDRPGYADAAETEALANSEYEIFTKYLKETGFLK